MLDEADGGVKLGVEPGHRGAPFLTKRPKTRVRLGERVEGESQPAGES